MNNITENFASKPGKYVSLFLSQEKNLKNISVTAVYACLIPSIIMANLFSIIGIFKTKKNKYASSRILFLALFLSDLTIGAIQLPLEIYLIWKSGSPTCLEIDLSQFVTIFPIALSGNILCIIPIDRYIHVVHSTRYEWMVTIKLLTVAIILMTLISFVWGVSTALLHANFVFLVLTVCEGVIIILGVWVNIAILINVKLRTKNSTTRQTALNTNLTKTILMIVTVMLIAYIPLIAHVNIMQYVLRNWTNLHSITKVISLRWAMIPSQLNAVINSVIYFTRNSRMKSYFKIHLIVKRIKNEKWKTSLPVTFNIKNKELALNWYHVNSNRYNIYWRQPRCYIFVYNSLKGQMMWKYEIFWIHFQDFSKRTFKKGPKRTFVDNIVIHWYYVKSVQIRSFFWSVFFCIRTRKNSLFGHFSRSVKMGSGKNVMEILYIGEKAFSGLVIVVFHDRRPCFI